MSHSTGIHHISAIVGDPQTNYDFYHGVLGLRLVKKTVNFDDPSGYHLYYGNESGDPGTLLTFFPWEYIKQGEPDLGQVVAVSFSIPTSSKEFWLDYLRRKKVPVEAPFERFGKEVIGLQGPDGLHLELVLDPQADDVKGWSGGPVHQEHAIRGIHGGATLSEKDHAPTGRSLEDDLGFELTDRLDDRYLFETEAEFGSVIEIVAPFDLKGRSGKGTIHHIAFRAEDKQDQQVKSEHLLNKGYHLTNVEDRKYFKSVYFHEPGGILFEIATDGPGFTCDESWDALGSTLQLPQWLESQRSSIEDELSTLT